MTPATFTISLLALDGLEMTKKCLDSVFAGGGDFDLILTDNASKDGTALYFAELAAKHPNVTVRSPGENTGFIPPNNAAFEMARARGSRYFITLNNDLVVPPGWLDRIAETFAANPKAAIVGPQGTISQLSNQMLGFARGKLEFIEGSLMAVKVELIKGSLFADYLPGFIYHEDSELSLRMQRAGYTIHQANFHVEHRNGQTCQRHPDAIKKCRESNIINQRVMLQRWAHWNRVRRFDFPILVRRKFASGDVLLTTPIIKALKETWPLCPIDVETNVPDVFAGNPNVRKAAPRIIPGRDTMLVNLDNAYERAPHLHVLESYARTAHVHPLVKPRLEIYSSHPAPAVMNEGKWCAIHVGPTQWPAKNWPVERWAPVVDWLRESGWKVLVLGDRGHGRLNLDLDKRNQKGVQELVAMIRRCKLFIGLDSFPAHVAAACEVPAVVLYGITNPDCFAVHTAPYIAVRSDPKHPMTGKRNKIANVTFIPSKDDVMRTISIEMVKEAVAEITKEAVVA